MERRLLRGVILAAVALTSAAGCRDDAPDESTTERVDQAAESADSAPGLVPTRQPLERAPGTTFGIPVPTGFEVDERTDRWVHFRSEADYRELVSFYRRELPDYREAPYSNGTKFEPQDGTGRALYVSREEQDGQTIVTYFHPGSSDSALLDPTRGADLGSAASVGSEGALELVPSGDGAQADQGAGQADEVLGGYRVVREEVTQEDGETVRTRYIVQERDEAGDAAGAGGVLLGPALSPRGRPYTRDERVERGPGVRQNGEPSLYHEPEVDRYGRPLNFLGNRRVTPENPDALF